MFGQERLLFMAKFPIASTDAGEESSKPVALGIVAST